MLKAGLVSAKQATDVERKQRAQRKAQGARKSQREADARRKRQEGEAARRAEADRRKSLVKRTDAEEKELALRVGQIADSNKADVKFGGRRRWYYVSRQNKVPSVELSDTAAERLESGDCALVECPAGHLRLVTAKGARRIAELDRRWLVVWKRAPGA